MAADGVTVDVVAASSTTKRPRRSASLKVEPATVKAAGAAAPRKNFIRPSGLRPGGMFDTLSAVLVINLTV